MTLSDFQRKLQSSLTQAMLERGLQWSPDRITSILGSNDQTEPVIEGAIGPLTVWIHPREAFIGGRTLNGREIDRRFEAEAYRNPDTLIESFVLQVQHYLDGGNENVRTH